MPENVAESEKRGPVLWVSAAGLSQHRDLRLLHLRLHPIAAVIAFFLSLLAPVEGELGLFLGIVAFYGVGVAVFTVRSRLSEHTTRLVGLMLLDAVVIAAVSAVYPQLWYPLLAIQILVISMGWLESKQATAAVVGIVILGMSVSGAIGSVEYWPLAVSLTFFLSASISTSALWSPSEVPLLAAAQSLQSIRAVAWQADPDGKIVEIVGPAESLTGVPAMDLLGCDVQDLVSPSDAPGWTARLGELEEFGSVSFVHELQVSSSITVRTSLRFAEDKLGRRHIHGVTVDISKAWQAGEAQRRHASVVQHMQDGLIIIHAPSGADGVTLTNERVRVDRMNSNAAAILSAPIDASWQHLGVEHPLLCERIRQAAETGAEGHWHHQMQVDDEPRWVQVKVYRLSDEVIAAQLMDVTAEKLEQERVRHLATHDHLTGLYNAAEFRRLLDERIEEDESVTVFLIDLDQFKPVNDTHGHAAGDVVLSKIGLRLRNSLKGEDVIARLGGDEFIGFVSGLSIPEDAENFRTRVEGVCSQPVVINDDLLVTVSASMGYVTRLAGGSQTADELIAAADAAMYANKPRSRRAAPELNQ